jgi:hypothetical protein
MDRLVVTVRMVRNGSSPVIGGADRGGGTGDTAPR